MPVYVYKCDVCGRTEDRVLSVAERDNGVIQCPNALCSGATRRDFASEHVHSTDQEYHTPVYSNALGINPIQIPEAMKRFPHHEYTPDGRMVFRSHAQRNRVLKELGWVDKDGFN